MQEPIPRFPEVPPLNEAQVAALTRIVFLDPPGEPEACDLAFIFGGTHPGLWRAAAEAYHRGLAPRLLVTGGTKVGGGQTADPISEARFLAGKLIDGGVPEECLTLEERSTNTLENVLYAGEVFDFGTIASVLLVYKSYVAGRQYRTLRRHLPARVRIVPFPFETTATGQGGSLVTRDNWRETAEGRARVYGEYVRIVTYGARGDIEALKESVVGLEGAHE